MTSEFCFLVTDARKLGYRIDVQENGYMLVYTGENPLLKKQYPEQFFSYQDAIEDWCEDRMRDLDIYERNLKLEEIVGPIEDGKLPAFAWPGGYPILYYDQDGDEYCADCAEDDPLVTDASVYYEGPPVRCVECRTLLKSAYGDPDESEKDNND